jgi:membrane-associated protease RseP (regulator of RpoE activity)
LAGLVVAIAALLAGLKSSAVTFDLAPGGTPVASSVLFALLSKISLGQTLEAGQHLQLSPLAFASWLGLLITALNLLPIGQLDGGHIARAMFGQRTGSVISTLSTWGLFLLAVFVWPALLMFALFVLFIAGKNIAPAQ